MRAITQRTDYVDASRRFRLSRQRLAESELDGQARAWKLWAVCMERTAGYSKSADRVHVVTLANLAGMRDDKASALLREFDRLGVVVWRKDTGRRSPGFLALPSWVEPDGGPRPSSGPKCPECGGKLRRQTSETSSQTQGWLCAEDDSHWVGPCGVWLSADKMCGEPVAPGNEFYCPRHQR